VNYKVLIISVVLFITACTSGQPNQPDVSKSRDELISSIDGASVEITRGGFVPRTITVKAGEAVTWFNVNVGAAWPASNRHPIHTNYPADYSQPGSYSGSQACLGRGQPKLGAFDSCKEIKPGETHSITFTQRGQWAYHNHIKPRLGGVVVVE